MKLFKLTTVICVVAFLSACGGMQKEAIGITERTAVLIMADDLIGATISTDDQTIIVVKEMLRDYDIGVLGVKDSEEEGLDTFVLDLNQGKHRIKLIMPSGRSVSNEIYLSTGQVRKWLIK